MILVVSSLTTLGAMPAAATDLGTTKAGVRSTEADLDRTYDVVRTFERWDSVFPDAEERQHLSQGRTLLVSVFPQRTDGTLVPWADIAAAEAGSALHDDLLRWSARLAPYAGQIYITFNHEPEAAKNLPLGEAADFKAAWNKMMDVFAAEGLATLGRLFIATSSAWDYDPADRRAFDHWYPGSATVDAVGGDAYNFVDCRPAEPTSWASLASIIEGQRAWGAANPAIELVLPEFASVVDPADPDRQAEWFRDARITLTDPAYSQFGIVAYFGNFDPANPGCDYVEFNDASQQAFYDFANDPGLGGSPAVGAGPSACVATVVEASVTIEWRPAYEAASYVLSAAPEGQPPVEIASGPLLSFNEPAAGSTYSVAAVGVGGAVSPTTLCTDPGPEPPPLLPPSSCEWARDEGFITVSWLPAEQATDYVVYRSVNGGTTYWRGRTADTELADTDLFANLTYQVRSRAIDGSLSAASTICVDTSPPINVADPEPPTDCAFVRDNGSIVVTWTQGINATETVIRRSVNGNGPYWRARTADMIFTDSDRAGVITYNATSTNAAGVTSAPATCADNTPPPVALEAPTFCVFIRAEGAITVTWTNGQGSANTVIRRTVNGNGPYWRTRAADTTFIDTDTAGTITYTATSRSAAGEFSAPADCTDSTPV